MELFPKKEIKENNVENNFLFKIRKVNTFNYFKHKNLTLKKRENSMVYVIKKNNQLSKKYNFTSKITNSEPIKINKKEKKLSNKNIINNNQNNAKSNLKQDNIDYININSLKKVVIFGKKKI